MLQNPCKTLGFKKNMVFKIPLGGGGKPYPASGLLIFRPSLFTIHYFLTHYSLFIIKNGHYSLIIIPHPDPHVMGRNH